MSMGSSYKPLPESPGKQYALAIVLVILPTVMTVLRFYSRFKRKAEILVDDWLILVALFFTYLTAIFMIIGTSRGLQGQHMEFTAHGAPVIDDPKYVVFLKMLYAGQLSQILAVGPGKLSVLFFYRRIFRGKAFHFICWVGIGIVSTWSVAFFFSNMLECLPIEEAFINAPGAGDNPKCIHAVSMYLSQVYSDLVIDILVMAVPIPFVWKLQMATRQKIAVLGIFLLGLMTTACVCAKMIIFNFVGHALPTHPDISYYLTPIVYWPFIEASLQIVTACMPMLRHIFTDILGTTGLTSLRKSQRSHAGYIRSDNDRTGKSSSASDRPLEYNAFCQSGLEHSTHLVEHYPLQPIPLKDVSPMRGILVEKAFDTRSDARK